MIRLGIIGAENSHSYTVAKLCNVDKAVPMRVPMIWGETKAFAKTAMEKGAIPAMVKDWREMLGKVDAVMIDHRHPAPHVEPTKFFIEHRVPTFTDKPFTYRLRDAIMLIELAAKKKTPLITFSGIAIQPRFQEFKKSLAKIGQVRAVNTNGPADIKSKYGGIFFYGIHQVDSIVELLGTAARSVFVHTRAPNAVASILFDGGVVASMNCIKQGGGGFHWTVCGDDGIATLKHEYVGNPYLTSAKLIYGLAQQGKNPFSRERMLAPVAILQAMEKSLKTGRPASVPKF